MVPIFRIVLLLAFALFWGGLTFYTGFVVRISHDVLVDPMDGGLITQRVTAALQMLGSAAVVLMACNSFHVVRYSKKYGYTLFIFTTIVGCALAGLFVVHGHLDAVIDLAASEITDRDTFVIGHRRYNQLTTIQWLGSLAYLSISIFAWRFVDTKASHTIDEFGGTRP